jgi:hypothetical protein
MSLDVRKDVTGEGHMTVKSRVSRKGPLRQGTGWEG